MASTISIINFTLVTVAFCSVTRSEFIPSHSNKINNTSPWKSGRTKRSLSSRMPYLIQIEVKYEADKEIKLLWTQKDPYLANEHLPIILPFADTNSNIMNDVGEFLMYYDAIACSAVVYFEKFNAFYGVIGMNYQIEGLPFNFDGKGNHRSGVIGKPFITKHVHPFSHIDPRMELPPPFDMKAWEDYLRSSDDDSVRSSKRFTSCDATTSSKRQRTKRHFDGKIIEKHMDVIEENNSTMIRKRRKTNSREEYFLEIMVFVTLDIVEILKGYFGKDHHIEWIVRYLIVYFNAVDMMFQKLRTNKIGLSINIATIVIEDELTLFDFITNGELQFTEVADKLPKYLNEHRNYFTPDSFDHVFIYTSRTIMDDVVQVNGLTKHGADLYEARKHNIFYDVVPITVVQYQFYFSDYVIAVHEIGRILDIKIALKEEGSKSIGQCYGIMQRQGPKCDDCLKWSDSNQKQFEIFFSQNQNRCFMLNKPRSVRPPGADIYLTPDRQCQCFGYNSHNKNDQGKPKKTVTISGCTVPLQCTMANGARLDDMPSVRPFDGTRCASKKVCWNQECVEVQSSGLKLNPKKNLSFTSKPIPNESIHQISKL